jgi:predicted metal-dependent hydrolase
MASFWKGDKVDSLMKITKLIYDRLKEEVQIIGWKTKTSSESPFSIVSGQKEDNNGNKRIELQNDKFLIFSKNSKLSRKQVRYLYEEWLFEKAQSIFEQKSKVYCMELGIKPTQITIKDLKNRWGSATKRHVINLNVNLLKAPESVIDYIILHEICHLKVKEHSHHFWDILHKYMPNYQEQVEWLRINGSRLVSAVSNR